VPKLIAEWNTELKLWINSTADLLSEHWEPFLATWPKSGMTQNGLAFELPTLEQHINASESLSLPTPRANEPGSTSPGYGDSLNDFASRITIGHAPKDLLRTPAASEAERGHQTESVARARGGQVTLSGQMKELFPTPLAFDWNTPAQSEIDANDPKHRLKVAVQVLARDNSLLPTPIVSDWKNGKSSPGYGLNLPETAKSLLPTPKALDGIKGNTQSSEERKAKGFYVDLPNVAIDLMPTTRKVMGKGATKREIEEGNPKKRLETEVMLFPTPNTMEHREIKTPEEIQAMKEKSPGGYRNLRESVINELPKTNWGKFEPAIRRWESVIGREAPAPTKPDGKDNGHRLSSLFTEWLMGLPEGWITGLGLKRNDELKLAGNGVVPQQAELALRILLEDDNLLERIKK
jgi:hypothetical protein